MICFSLASGFAPKLTAAGIAAVLKLGHAALSPEHLNNPDCWILPLDILILEAGVGQKNRIF